MTGDGASDLLIGAYWRDTLDPSTRRLDRDTAGQTFLFYGDPTAPFSGNIDFTTADATFSGDIEGGGAGWDSSAAGDLNGDGLADLAITAPGSEEIYVVYGRPTSDRLSGDLGRANADAIFYATQGRRAGYSLSTAGDVNGDGIDDLLVGASNALAGEEQHVASAYLLYGRSGAEAWSGRTRAGFRYP